MKLSHPLIKLKLNYDSRFNFGLMSESRLRQRKIHTKHIRDFRDRLDMERMRPSVLFVA
jgi:hypothetical protein